MRNRLAYFNYAGLARVSKEIRAKVEEANDEFDNLLFSEAGVERYQALLNDCRGAVATMLGAPGAAGISLLPNATFGLNVALSIIGVNEGETVVTSDQEHPALETWLESWEGRGVQVERVSADTEEDFVEKIDTLIRRGKVKLIVLSHVSYKDGRILPVERIGELATGSGIAFVVDGSQAVGQLKVDLSRIKPWIYVFSGHKWLFGPMGTGGLWASALIDGYLEKHSWTWASWSTKSIRFNGGRFEGGTTNFGLAAGLLEACRQARRDQEERCGALEKWRWEISRRLQSGAFHLPSKWKGQQAPGILTYRLPEERPSWELADSLFYRYRVTVKPFKPPEKPNAIRISFAPWTEEEDVQRLVEALRQEIKAQD